MKLKVRYYGLLTDITSCEREILELNGAVTSEDLTSALYEKYQEFKAHSIVFFVNGRKPDQKETIAADSEIDCMPPFAGG